MAISIVERLTLYADQVGLVASLRAQPLKADGSTTGALITTGFVALGGADYRFAGNVPDDTECVRYELSSNAGVAVSVGERVANLQTPTVAEIADAVWDEALSGHTAAGSAGKALSDTGSSASPLTTALRYGTMLCTYSEPGSVLSDFAVNVGEDTWIESKVVNEDGSPIPLDGYALTATLTGSGGFTQALDGTKVTKIVDEDGVNIDGRFRWRAQAPLTTTVRRNVRFTLLLSGGAGNVRTALARVQVEG